MFKEPQHGRKRPAENDPEDGNQPLAKRFGCLRIDPCLNDIITQQCGGSSTLQLNSLKTNDMMMLDDTEHTIYIHDLDNELADSGPSECSVTFLPGVGASLTSIPKLLTMDIRPQCNDLVLYQDPKSLTVPQDRDFVRKAILEMRQRVRAGQNASPVPFAIGPGKPSRDTARDIKSYATCCADGGAMEVETAI